MCLDREKWKREKHSKDKDMVNTEKLAKATSWEKSQGVKKLYVTSTTRSSIAASKMKYPSLPRITFLICEYSEFEAYAFEHSRIMDKHLKTLAPRHVDTKFIKMDAEVSNPLP